MLVLQRYEGLGVTILVPPSDKERVIKVSLVQIKDLKRARIGFEADRDVVIWRDEIWDEINHGIHQAFGQEGPGVGSSQADIEETIHGDGDRTL